jgi:hypothetical protein
MLDIVKDHEYEEDCVRLTDELHEDDVEATCAMDLSLNRERLTDGPQRVWSDHLRLFALIFLRLLQTTVVTTTYWVLQRSSFQQTIYKREQ